MREKRTCKLHKFYKLLCCLVYYLPLTSESPCPQLLCPTESYWMDSHMLIWDWAAQLPTARATRKILFQNKTKQQNKTSQENPSSECPKTNFLDIPSQVCPTTCLMDNSRSCQDDGHYEPSQSYFRMFIIFKTENTATFKDIQCLKVIVDIQINTCVCCWAYCVP